MSACTENLCVEHQTASLVVTIIKQRSLVSLMACLCFRYRHWKLGEDIDLIVRCEHDGVMTGANGEVSFINVKTLNEWDSRVRTKS